MASIVAGTGGRAQRPKHMPTIVLLVALIFAANNAACAESLDEALVSTYFGNPQLLAQRASTRATDENISQAMSSLLPQIFGNAATGYKHTEFEIDGHAVNKILPGANVPDATIEGDDRPYGYSVTLQQQIFKGFQNINSIREAEANALGAREDLRDTEQTTLLSAVSSYMDVVQNQAIVRLRENNVKVLTDYEASNQRQFNAGDLTSTDLAQSKASRATAVASLEAAKAQYQSSLASYEEVVGHPADHLFTPASIDHFLPGSLQEAQEVAQFENPSIGSAVFQEAAAAKSVAQQRGQLLPEVNIQLKYEDEYNPVEGLDFAREASATVGVKVPFYQGGRVASQVRQAKQIQIQRLEQVRQARQQTQSSVVSAWAQVNSIQAQLMADQASVDSNKVALAGVHREQKAGTRTVQDVLNAEQDYLTAQVQLTIDDRNLVVANYTLLQAIGRLTAAYLKLPIAIYDAAEVDHSERHLLWRTEIKPESHYYEYDQGWEPK
ncbi:MAG: TolC family outer membrane protein [Hyphomicrobium sp.]|nr:TolC family outer membrane protein [Hyphomicrobium sp.]